MLVEDAKHWPWLVLIQLNEPHKCALNELQLICRHNVYRNRHVMACFGLVCVFFLTSIWFLHGSKNEVSKHSGHHIVCLEIKFGIVFAFIHFVRSICLILLYLCWLLWKNFTFNVKTFCSSFLCVGVAVAIKTCYWKILGIFVHSFMGNKTFGVAVSQRKLRRFTHPGIR